MMGVINDIGYINTEGFMTYRVSLMTYDILTLKDL
jgi:hypothetical protein